MADQWFVQRDGKKFGPFSAEKAKQLAASGAILPTDLIQKQGMDKWVPARAVKGLFPITPAAGPPATATPAPIAEGPSPHSPAVQDEVSAPLKPGRPKVPVLVWLVAIPLGLLVLIPLFLLLSWGFLAGRYAKRNNVIEPDKIVDGGRAFDFLTEHQNLARVEQKYRNHRVRVVGTCYGVDQVWGGWRVEVADFMIPERGSVYCYFQDSQRDKVAKLRRRHEVFVVGTHRGTLSGSSVVILEDCELTTAPAPTIAPMGP
jgi:hypothetical protein